MKFITTKSNQTNFSKQELEFLSNFSNISDLYEFSDAVQDLVEKVVKYEKGGNEEISNPLLDALSGVRLVRVHRQDEGGEDKVKRKD